ncbi:tail fiber assembly protein [Prodigiosinella confusarubida]|uniref:Tail fiber assembly protein n=1 Tax=Serratia sp. (strain ATCC 39006) TaxID=104623 RepID=A0A2I5T8U4_SERS3|nr:tail fiber assembly protein [Serratia sp. ATCC 39006]AUH00989.1 tail fiber assembly protein [Serratia sp. ATCC 39006]AUH05310.1 tail fiber assembly protein [Serratia sp. ATCC 39006]
MSDSIQAQTHLNKNGLAENAGWITVYHADPQTREYHGASDEYLMQGVGIPANSYADEPTSPEVGQAVRRNDDGSAWEQVSDYRGQTVYHTQTGQAQTVTALGNLPDDVTLMAPATPYDKWDGSAWVTNTDAQHAAAVTIAQQELTTRRATANARITELTYAVELAMATDEEKNALLAWKKYVVFLSRVDTATAPNIDWPTVPEN